MARKFCILILLLIYISAINANSQLCINHSSCEKCLDAAENCSWCTDRKYNMQRSRCMTKDDLINADCRKEFIQENKFLPIEVLKSDDLQDFTKVSLNAVQIRPQIVKMNLRKMQPQVVKLTYKPAHNYPLDLYYLMDLTFSMRDDKETLVNVGDSLSTALKNLTENFRLAFGSFADKPRMPYIIPGMEQNPCAVEQSVCEPTYGYRHKLSFTDNIAEFVQKVNSSEITGNLDNLEGGMDALMQILVCNDAIGWKEKARKIVVFASDGLVHFGGDGFLAGVVEKNDKQCHLSESGEYLGSLVYDYPSLEEIYRELLRTKINVIFAVTSDVIFHYNQMHKLMEEISSVGQLTMDSSNILQLVEAGYKEVVKRAQFDDDSPDFINVQYKTTCGGKYSEMMDLNKCDNIEIGKEYEFEVHVTLLDYPEDDIEQLKIKIEEAGINLEGLQIDIQIDHPCTECASQEVEEFKSKLCSARGEFTCGVCLCDDGWVGTQCECNLQEHSNTKEMDNQCRENITMSITDSHLGPMCSDRGECFCGQCYCNSLFAGKFCECQECPIINGEQCGGVSQGQCNCDGSCSCKPGFSGDQCDCETTTSTCKAPNSQKICSDQGSCKCGKCECEPGSFGSYCESSQGNELNNTLCVYYETCVQCIIHQSLQNECTNYHQLCTSQDKGSTLYHSEFLDDVTDYNIQCITRIKHKESTCEFRFTYLTDEMHQTHLYIQNEACPKVNMAAYSFFAIILFTFLAGIAVLLLVKCNIMISDRREFARFDQERREQTMYRFESPIYKSPVTSYEVPLSAGIREENFDNAYKIVAISPTTPSPSSPNFPEVKNVKMETF